VRGRLVGDDVEVHAVGEESREGIGGVSDECDRSRAVRVEVRRQRLFVAGDEVDPAIAKTALGPLRVYLDDEGTTPVLCHGEALGAAHPAQTGGEHPLPRERAAEMSCADCSKGLVGEAEDALRADVEPACRRHLAVHGQPGVLEPAERVLVRPGRHDHGCRDEHPWCIGVRRQGGDGLAGLDDESFLRA